MLEQQLFNSDLVWQSKDKNIKEKKGQGTMNLLKVLGVCASVFFSVPAFCASIVASINGTPITDTDVTLRTKLMARQGQVSTDNRRVALQNIIDDNIKIAYANNFNAVPDDKTVEAELKKLNLGEDISASELEMARSALRAEIAWQIIVARTVLPTVDVSAEDINSEKADLAREHGLPVEVTMIRLMDVPAEIVSQLTKPKSCDGAIEMAESYGGSPHKFTVMQYDLSPQVREQIASLPELTWSPAKDGTVLLVCSTRKTDEYKNLDTIIKQNAMYKQAMFLADQQLKHLRRKAVIVINDDRYKL